MFEPGETMADSTQGAFGVIFILDGLVDHVRWLDPAHGNSPSQVRWMRQSTLGPGQFFGHGPVLGCAEPQDTGYIALTACKTFVLHASALESIIHYQPVAFGMIQEALLQAVETKQEADSQAS
jgi:hypothetical protein